MLISERVDSVGCEGGVGQRVGRAVVARCVLCRVRGERGGCDCTAHVELALRERAEHAAQGRVVEDRAVSVVLELAPHPLPDARRIAGDVVVGELYTDQQQRAFDHCRGSVQAPIQAPVVMWCCAAVERSPLSASRQ
eukprot:4094888-Prymnesium_polylepis.1